MFVPSDVERKLRYLESGHDIFGNNKLFFPRKTWEDLIVDVEEFKQDAKTYEDAFNEIISTVETSGISQQVSNM